MIRLRRLRGSEAIRNMVRENRVNKEDLVYPMFVAEGTGIKNPVDSMPGIYQYSLDTFEEELRRVADAGISAVLLFGIPAHKDEVGSSAYDDQGIMQKAVRRIKELYPDMIVIADICLCEYTSHGHCGIIHDGKILNDETLPYLGKMAVSLAKAGADMVAPSDMMDGHTAYIRKALDDNGLTDVLIMGYSAKFASGYYAPFRDAAHSAPQFGDRRTYQMDPANNHGQAGTCLSGCSQGCEKPHGLSDSGVQCQRRVLHGQGSCGKWLDRREEDRHGKHDSHETCRSRDHHNLSRHRRGTLA